jgi:asparagine synthase (glutamine-hydrolysing)
MDKISSRLRELLIASMQKNPADGILLSGGLDSTIVASINPKLKAFTVSLENRGGDIGFSQRVVHLLRMEHFHQNIETERAVEAVPQVMRVLKSFDPALPNDLPVWFGLKKAKEMVIRAVMTGDGSDELFGGYSFMEDIEDLEGYIQRISRRMFFSSNRLGEYLGIRIVQPYLDRDVVDLALSLGREWKIRRENGTLFGKWILRKAFEGTLPQEIIWQEKRPLEIGSGMTELRKIISEKVSDKDFQENADGVRFYNKEHFYYYKIYKQLFSRIPEPENGEKACPGCGTGIQEDAYHCRLCGWVKDFI